MGSCRTFWWGLFFLIHFHTINHSFFSFVRFLCLCCFTLRSSRRRLSQNYMKDTCSTNCSYNCMRYRTRLWCFYDRLCAFL
ncbi:MAG: hypothetical protein EXX96DRAFT_576887 [Benjaminiella poitrasii]|nr:MAG: hypothetical protein EXX96DRAFT_576887 [Benjaminiella poitrasii]